MNTMSETNARALLMNGTARPGLFRSSILLILIALGRAGSVAGAGVDFQRDVRPILAEHCTKCHGVDAATRKSGLRLDQRATALAGGRSGVAAIVPGRPEQSEL